MEISNSIYKIQFSSRTGYISSITVLPDEREHSFHDQFLEYQTKRSGSYLFRPTGEPTQIQNLLKSIFISKGPLVEIAIISTNRLVLCVKLFKQQKNDKSIEEFIEMTHYIKPIPGNTEMVMRLGVDRDEEEQGNFYTFDGYRFVKREISYKAPIAGRFYPAVAGALYRFQNYHLTVNIMNI